MGGKTVAVVGGGISGLAAAWQLCQSNPDLNVVVLDGSDAPGGKLRRAQVAGVGIDVGAESILARRPEGTSLARAVGLADRLTQPAILSASIWSRGLMHPMPPGALMGVLANPAAAEGILDAGEIAWAEGERDRPMEATLADLSVGEFVGSRVGSAVVDRLVEPVLGGVYAGHAHHLSLRATVPELWAAATAGESVTVAAQRASSRSSQDRRPVFAGVVGGVSTLAEELVKHLLAHGVQIRSNTIVRNLRHSSSEGRRGWTLITGPVPAPVTYVADALVIAVPAAPAARLLSPHIPHAALELGAIAYASMAVVSVALPRLGMRQLSGSGFLVPPVDGRAVKAATFTTNKWTWVADVAPQLFILRASLGRAGEEALLQRSDAELVRLVLADLADALGGELPTPVDSHVQRWGGALPQYGVGHVDRVARIRAAVSRVPGVEVAGAAYEGIGIPACIASGQRAAEAVLTHLHCGPVKAPE